MDMQIKMLWTLFAIRLEIKFKLLGMSTMDKHQGNR